MNITDCIKNAIVREFSDLVVSFEENDEGSLSIFVDNIEVSPDFLIFGAVGDLICQCVSSKALISMDLHVALDDNVATSNAIYVAKLSNIDNEEE